MRYFRDGVLKMIIKKVLPGDGSTFLYHNSGSFHGKVNPFSVVEKAPRLKPLKILWLFWGP